ncbi:MAG TPA: PorV/PorQ family protein [Bacteroidota bacterium]|nr:PorV/PorQ family protein [Bacteroidota bacterium]
MKRHVRQIVSGALCAALLAAPAAAQTVVAKYAGEFIALGVGARALGMGGAFAALASDVTAGYWNPAGLARVDYPEFILMHDAEFGGLVNNDYGAVAIPVGEKTTLGLSVIRVGVDDIADTRNAGVDASGNVTYDPAQFTRVDPSRVTYFNAADWAVYFSYARRQTETFSYGASVKLIRRDLDEYSAMGIGFDIGLWYSPLERLALGANLQDVTTTLVAWNTGRNELISPTLKLGSAYFIDAPGGRIAPAVDADVRFEDRQTASEAHIGPVSIDLHGGLEYAFHDLVALRVGYSDVKQLTLGAGVHFPKLNIDYSFARFGGADQLDNTHRISIMFTLEADQYKRPAE